MTNDRTRGAHALIKAGGAGRSATVELPKDETQDFQAGFINAANLYGAIVTFDGKPIDQVISPMWNPSRDGTSCTG